MHQELGLWTDDIANDQMNLGFTVLYLGDDRQAASWFKQAFWGNKQLFYRESFGYCLGGFAAVAVVRGNFETAAVLFGAVEANIQKKLAEGVNLLTLIQPVDRKELDRYQGMCRAGLGGEAFETAMQRGSSMNLDEAITFALEKLGESSPVTG